MKRQDGSNRDAELAKLLAAGMSQVDAGKQLGMSRSSVQRRLRDPGFGAEVNAERAANTATVRERLTGLVHRSLDRLELVLIDDEETTANQVRAALGVLAEYGRHTVPQQVAVSGGMSLDIQQMSAEDVLAELEGMGTEIATALGRSFEPQAGTPTEHTWEQEPTAAVRRSETTNRVEDQRDPGLSETVSAPTQDVSEDSDSASTTEPGEVAGGTPTQDQLEQDDLGGEDATVVPLRNPHGHNPRPGLNPWRGTDPYGTSIWP